jgi:3-hydroxymyristoyl/3-hydroxydecanoyl-(acyl carrier protein) dehydratase
MQLPVIEALERSNDHVKLRFVISPTLRYFEGHFAGCPVLPGVVQVGWAIEFARLHIPFSARFRSLAAVKFTRVIQPNAVIALDLVADAARRALSFEYRSGDEACSSGRILFQ